MTRVSYGKACDRLEEIIRAESNGMTHFYVAIDGARGAGKTALADELARRLGGFVIHTDDFALPARSLSPSRASLPGGAFDYERFTAEVARPFLSKKLPVYGVYREETCGTAGRVNVPERGVYLIEGCYALHPEVPDFYDLRIVLHKDGETDDPVRAYLSAYLIEEFSDVIVSDDADGEEETGGFSGFTLPLSLDGNG